MDFEGQTVFGYMRDLGGEEVGRWVTGEEVQLGDGGWGAGGEMEESRRDPGGAWGAGSGKDLRAVHQIYFLFL